ncbi:T9SS type A sorting domain-containing protein, partial [uncultured Polaribacter sp.]|uniref:T9SS type A sorting domain-containing protein n=1 Tax=uncultured Polaribacter sp. TaxID=174711 RepID=UPI002621A46C
SSKTAIVTVQDVIAPTVLTQNITVDLDANGTSTITPEIIDNGSFDNCTIQSSVLDITSFDCANVGENTVTLTVTDVNGNVSSKTAIVTVQDVIAPTVLTQNITVDLDANGTSTITPEMIDNGSTDNCNFTTSLDILNFTCENVGENPVILTVTDASGNIATAKAIVKVQDITPANVVTQNIEVFLDTYGNASITQDQIDNGSTDACGITSLVLDNTSFSCDNLGENTVTLTATDINGNVSSATAIVTVTDNIAPIVETQNIQVALDANGNATITPEDVLVSNADDIETGKECNVTDAKFHAMYLSNYVKNYNNNYERSASKDASKSKKEKVDYSVRTDVAKRWGALYKFDSNGGKITKNLDGTANVAGTLVNKFNSKDKWIVTLNLKNASTWSEWRAKGKTYKGFWHTKKSYENWMYYELASGSKLTGAGNNSGTEVPIYHAPVSRKVGFQLGIKANLYDSDFGLSGWFYYKNRHGRWAQGDFNFDISNCDDLPIPEETVFTSDNCSIANTALDVTSFGCDDLGENTVNVSVTDQSGNTTTKAVTVTVLGDTPTVTIPDFKTVSGQKRNAVFLGYAETAHLCPTVSGGKGFTYEWKDEAGNLISTKAQPIVKPRVTTTYTVTVTNSNGCSAIDSIEICVIDTRSKNRRGNYNDKVLLHYNTRRGPKEFSVNKRAVKSFLRRGYTLGASNATCKTNEDVFEQPVKINTVTVFPNPSKGIFNVKLKNLEGSAHIKLFNMQGRLIQYRYIRNVRSQSRVTMGNYRLRDGVYAVKVITNGTTYTENIIIKK